jgi:hypothetical protein
MLWARRYAVELTLVAVLALAVAFFGYLAVGLLPGSEQDRDFRGSAALNDIGLQMAYGSRAVGTQSNLRQGDWLVQQLTGLGWDVVIQEFTLSDALKGRNLVAVRSPDGAQTSETPPPVGLVVAHYDSRIAADRDASPENQARPALGANDGASGTAVLLELARAIDVESAGQTVCLAFTDGDANAGIPGWTEPAGSAHLARTIARDVPRCANPAWVVALGMVGGVDATFPIDAQSDPALQASLWSNADALGFADQFTDAVTDGALPNPFAQSDVPTVLIDDPTYPYVATLADAADKVNAETMEAVGRTVETWVESGSPR